MNVGCHPRSVPPESRQIADAPSIAAARATVGRSHISTEIVTHEPWPAFAVNVPSRSRSPVSHATVGVHAEAGSLVETTPRSARRICARRTALMSGASSIIRRIAGLPLIEVTYERLCVGFRGAIGVTARPRTRAERSTTSRSHISRRIEGHRGDDGTGRREMNLHLRVGPRATGDPAGPRSSDRRTLGCASAKLQDPGARGDAGVMAAQRVVDPFVAVRNRCVSPIEARPKARPRLSARVSGVGSAGVPLRPVRQAGARVRHRDGEPDRVAGVAGARHRLGDASAADRNGDVPCGERRGGEIG